MHTLYEKNNIVYRVCHDDTMVSMLMMTVYLMVRLLDMLTLTHPLLLSGLIATMSIALMRS